VRPTVRVLVLVLAFAAWLPTLHLVLDVWRPKPAELGTELLAELREPWQEGSIDVAIADERAVNPEWDFMARTFVVLALANESIADPDRRVTNLATIDRILADTLAREAADGMHAFLLPYGRGPFVDPEGNSLFIDGELALMLAARLTVAPDRAIEIELRTRIERIVAQMERGPVLSGESYPDECWTFCNTTALAAIALSDRALDQDHGELLQRWVAMARERLVDPETGLLVSSYTLRGEVLDGPEGSSLWMSAHNLLLVDPAFAREQFARAREELYGSALGFGWAREWPETGDVRVDVDSGPIVPVLDASPGSSGLAVLAATAFGDEDMRDELLRSLELAAFPIEENGRRHYAAAGLIGNGVVAYALHFGPLWHAHARATR
jgi:hypothetical protein